MAGHLAVADGRRHPRATGRLQKLASTPCHLAVEKVVGTPVRPAAQVQSVAMKMLAIVSPPTAAKRPFSTFSSSRLT